MEEFEAEIIIEQDPQHPTDLAPQAGAASAALVVATPPVPRCEVTTRTAMKDDLAFIDQLQKMHGHMVGFTPLNQLEKRIAAQQILIAEDACGGAKTPIGYCIFQDHYMKREEVGIVFQLNVLPLKQRHLVGATLVKTVFDRSAYGCKLYCCWCAQDIQANWFWESIGFIPLAFRTGSRAKQRIHIFWQRRVRENDDSTPYWFPSKTENGGVMEDRIVLPIPPGTHWRDAKPVILPGLPQQPQEESGRDAYATKMLPGGAAVKPRPEQPRLSAAQKAAIHRSASKHLQGVPLGKKAVIGPSGIRYVDRTDYVPEEDAPEELATPGAKKPKKPRAPRQKNDPKYVAAARELRDRYLEQINLDRLLPAACGKYDVSRQLAAAPTELKQTPLLDAA